MINKIKLRGANQNSLKSSLKYIRKYQHDENNGGPVYTSIPKKATSTEEEYSKVFVRKLEKTRQKNQKNLYAFASLSFSHADSKRLTDEEALEIAKEFYLNEAYDPDRHFHFTVENDKEHKHVHAIIGLTNIKTKKVNNKFVDFQPIADKLEKKYNLEKVARNSPAPSPYTSAPNTKKIEDRTGEQSLKSGLKDSVSTAFLISDTFDDFLKNLKQLGVDLIPNVNATDMYGVCFDKDGEFFKGSEIGYAARVVNNKFKKTKGYKEYVDFAIANRSENQIAKDLIAEKMNKENKKFKLGRNFIFEGNKVLHRENKKLAYTKIEKGNYTIHDNNLKTITQAVKEMHASGTQKITTHSDNKSYKRNVWIVCKQNNIEVADFYTPRESDYLFAIKNCFDENQKEALTKEMKERFKERKKNKNGLYLDE